MSSVGSCGGGVLNGPNLLSGENLFPAYEYDVAKRDQKDLSLFWLVPCRRVLRLGLANTRLLMVLSDVRQRFFNETYGRQKLLRTVRHT